MSDPIKRREITHVDEIGRSATSTVQWLAEKLNGKGQVTHPITHNNKLTIFICGEEGFADIATEITKAQQSIDLCCWGFDPGMELVRDNQAAWPRGVTYGDLLIDAGKRGIKVRLLVWYDMTATVASNPRNMPGHTHGTMPWSTCNGNATYAAAISAAHSIRMLLDYRKNPIPQKYSYGESSQLIRQEIFPVKDEKVAAMAREEYCHSWYFAAFNHQLKNIEIRTRGGTSGAITASIDSEPVDKSNPALPGLERLGLTNMGTHHQKPILIDFAYEAGAKAIGYVIGLNSVTDYWDTALHLLEDGRREPGGKTESNESAEGKQDDPGYRTLKPYQDYACRINGGKSLLALYSNFVTAWHRASKDAVTQKPKTDTDAPFWNEQCDGAPTALLRPARPGNSTVQIVRTQPEEHDKSVRDIYAQATDIAAMASGYLYVENQYFQYEPWSRRLMTTRKRVIEGWKKGSLKAGKTMRDIPIMHLLVVIPQPERAQMVPRTYDTLAVLGQQEAMTGQSDMIKTANINAQAQQYDVMGNPVSSDGPLTAVTQHSNEIDKPDTVMLESTFGLKVAVAMLNTCAFVDGRWRYREVYIHSKLMLADDVFLTLGSANLNLRSMTVDSELNLATTDALMVRDLRCRIWRQLSGGQISGNDGTQADIKAAYKDWMKLMATNQKKKFADGYGMEKRKMTGFLLPLKDPRSSTIRLA